MEAGGRPWDPGLAGSSGLALADGTNHPNSTHLSSTPSPNQESQSSSSSHSPSSASPSPTWRAIYKLEFGAKPERRNRKEWVCSLECKKKNQVISFKDAQATEKHIMREHPDPMYNKFVCLKDGCRKEKVSPQQILDHMGQKRDKGGHLITTKIEKDENLRAVKTNTGEKFRVLRDKASFAWYICVPNQPSSPPDSRSPSPTDPNHSVASLNSLPETSEAHSSTLSSSSTSPESQNTGSPGRSVQATCSIAASSLVEQSSNCQTSEAMMSDNFFALPG